MTDSLALMSTRRVRGARRQDEEQKRRTTRPNPEETMTENYYDDPDQPVTCNPDDIATTLGLVADARGVLEVRALGGPRMGTVSGYFDTANVDLAVRACCELSGQAEGVYLTLNPAHPDLLARVNNGVREWAKHTTGDREVLERRWLLIDFDPVRPAGIPSTDGEHEASLSRAEECRGWLADLGAGHHSVVFADSGNGAHLLLRVDLPNDGESLSLCKSVLAAADFRFTDGEVAVDQTTANAARISKVYGTLACKGDGTSDRPHRLARLLAVPDGIQPASRDDLERVAATLPRGSCDPRAHTPAGTATDNRASLQPVAGGVDVERWIADHGLSVALTKLWQQGQIWVLRECPWDARHSNRAAFIIRHATGAISAGCHHNSCRGKGWHELRDTVEPGWRQSERVPATGLLDREFRRAAANHRVTKRGAK
jgi:hypothetical protein